MANIRVCSTDKALSSYGGLVLLETLFETSKTSQIVSNCLPTLVSGTGRSAQKLKNLVMAFGAGIHCIDDIKPLSDDQGFLEACDGISYTPKSYGGFLRSFQPIQAKQLNQHLSQQAYALRSRFLPKQTSITIDLDSTPNEQYGKKIEGVAYNYKNQWCLDTLHTFDENGLQYWSDVRPGSFPSS